MNLLALLQTILVSVLDAESKSTGIELWIANMQDGIVLIHQFLVSAYGHSPLSRALKAVYVKTLRVQPKSQKLDHSFNYTFFRLYFVLKVHFTLVETKTNCRKITKKKISWLSEIELSSAITLRHADIAVVRAPIQAFVYIDYFNPI